MVGSATSGAEFDRASACAQHLPERQRSEGEDLLFKKALSFLGTIYSHKYTRVLMLTKLPEGYPDGYVLPEGANVAEYADRGWVSLATSRPISDRTC